jgi:FtsH-binding integral membrane protein
MSDFDRNAAATEYGRPLTRAEAAVVDAGLRAYMLRIYNYMVLGLAITGFAALGAYMLAVTSDLASASYVLRGARLIPATAGMAVQSKDILLTNFGYLVFFSPLKWVIALSPLVMLFLPGLRGDSSPTTAQIMFWIFSALIGVSLGVIFLVFAHTSIVRVFFITAASFGALSLWGYTTQRDISGWGSFLIMGAFGILIALLVNAFFQSPAMQWVISVIGVLVFAGLTAYDTQRLKSEYIYGAMEGEVLERSAIQGALSLYLNFINLFTFLLQLFGQRNE